MPDIASAAVFLGQGTLIKRNNTAWSDSIQREYGFKQPYTRQFRCDCGLGHSGRWPKAYCLKCNCVPHTPE